MKEEPHPLLKQHDPASPTVIHNPEENETLLGRWVLRALGAGPRFWVVLVLVVAGAIGIAVAANMLGARGSEGAKAWIELSVARSSDQQQKVADDYPDTPAGRWALLEAGGMVYNRGFDTLSTNKDAASPLFKSAYDLYAKAYERSANTDPTIARLAAFGMARTLEASNDLSRAVEQYRRVASSWPDTPEAKQAEKRARELEDKRNVEFYQWLATYKPAQVTLPPLGRGIIGDLPPLPGTPGGASMTPAGSTPLPDNVFETSPGTPAATPPATPPAEPRPEAPDLPKPESKDNEKKEAQP